MFESFPSLNHRHNSQTGFTLVELMVSATILGLATIGAFAMIGVGRTVDADGVLRRQAYQFASAALEDPKYGYQNYPVTETPTTSVADLKIDGRTVKADIEVVASAVQNTTLQAGPPDEDKTIQIPYQLVTVKVEWPKGSPTDQVVLAKWVTDAR